MLYDELHQCYGSRIAKRVQSALSAEEFSQIDVADLPEYLTARAEAAHRQYQTSLENPFVNDEKKSSNNTDALCRAWREAEDLSYLINVAGEVNANVQLKLVNHR
ncbi:MAG: hypothetical protein WAO98_06580 [Alphaproteobacteria bacterium]